MGDARDTAARILFEVRRHGGWPDQLLRTRLSALPPREAALCARLTYGVLQNKTLLDFYITSFSHLPLGRIQPQILDILRLGIFQLKFLDRIPPHAALNQSVEMARAVLPRAAGFVNATLRAALRAEVWPEPRGATPEETLSIRYSQPVWQIREVLVRIGAEATEALLAMNNDIPPLWVRANTLKTTAEDLRNTLSRQGVEAEPHPFLKDYLRISPGGDIARLPAFAQGLFLVADPAAQLAVMAAAPQPGENVVDGCAAPGGKSFLAALAMQNEGRILAADIHPHKIRLIQDGASRLGITCLTARLQDAGAFDPALENTADLVIADLPCSGLGVIRKKPDIRDKTEDEADKLPAVQARLLTNLARYVRPGGRLLYCTCTLRRAENEAVVEAFLAEQPAFSHLPFSLPTGDAPGYVTLWPPQTGTDGFFICMLRKTV